VLAFCELHLLSDQMFLSRHAGGGGSGRIVNRGFAEVALSAWVDRRLTYPAEGWAPMVDHVS